MYPQSQTFNVALKNIINRTLLGSFLLTLCVSVSAELVERAAIIKAMNGPSSIFVVLRGAKKITTVAPLMTLQDGDWLCVRKLESTYLRNSKNFVTLTFGGNQSETITYNESPYLVKKRDTAPMIVENVANEMNSWWHSLYKHYIEAVGVFTKSPQWFLSMPLLTKYDNNKLIAGERTLYLGWQGGIAPYWVRVYQGEFEESKEPLLKQTGISSKRVQFKKQMFNAGFYTVAVSDKREKPVYGKFQVVKGAYPSLPNAQEMKASTMPEWVKQTLRAAWLAQKGAWKLEAYQQVAGMPETNQPALLVREGLEAGK
jgi:hypothetical protein